MWQSYSTYSNSIGKKIHTLPRCGLVTVLIQIARHILCSIRFGVVLFAKVCFFIPAQFCKVVDFTLALLYPNFKLQYLMNYSSDFNNFFQIPIASSLYYTTVVIRRPEFWGPNFYGLFFKYKLCFYENIINNDTNHTNYDVTMCQSYSTYFNSIGKKIHTLPRCGLVTI